MYKFIVYIAILVSTITYAQPTGFPLELRDQFNGQYDFTVIGNTFNFFDNLDPSVPPCEMAISSSATLNLLPNQNVISAFMYWSGVGDGTFQPNINLNNTNIIPEQVLVADPEDNGIILYFGAVAEITELIQNTGNGSYIVNNFDLNPILVNYCSSATYYAGWSIVVIYEDDDLPPNQINIYDGLVYLLDISGLNPGSVDLEISNFEVNNTGSSKLGVCVYNGSPNIFFDEALKFNGNILSNFLNPPDNPFNGTNSYTGSTNLFNMDLDFFDVSSFVNVGDTSATITFESSNLRILQNAVLKVPTQLPEPTVSIINNQTVFCETENIELDILVENTNATAPLPAASPVDVFYENTNGDLVLTQSFSTSNPIPIDGSENFVFNFLLPPDAVLPLQLTARVNLLDDGSVVFNENNPDNNFFTISIDIVQPPVINILPVALSACGNLSTNDPVDLTQNDLSSLGLTNPEDFNIQYFTSNSDAQTGDNPIPNPESYVLTSNPQDIFIRVENAEATACFTLESFEVSYQETPDIQQTINLNQCQENSESIVFDLTTNDAIAIGIADPSNTNISYHETLANAQSDSEPIPNPANYSPLNNSQTIFIRAENANNPECFSIAGFDINTFPVIINNVNDLNIQACIFPGESVVFDLTENSELALGNQNPDEFLVSYFISEDEAQNNLNAIGNPSNYDNLSNPQTIWLRLENAGSTSVCYDVKPFQIEVSDASLINVSPDPLVSCDLGGGFAEFDLTQSVDEIAFGNSGIAVSFHLSLSDAENNTNPLSSSFNNTVSGGQTVFFRTEEAVNGCVFTGNLELIVLEKPELNPDNPILSACAEDGNTGTFNLEDINPTILVNGDSSDFEINYHLSENNAINGTDPIVNFSDYSNTTNPQNLWVRVSNDNDCLSTAGFQLEVLTGAVIEDTTIDDVFLCSETVDGLFVTLDLTEFDQSINPSPDEETLVVYYEGLADFNAGNAIENPDDFSVNSSTTTIIAEVVNVGTLCVSPMQVSFDIFINPLPDFNLPENTQICIDSTTDEIINTSFSPPVLETDLSETEFTFEWFLNGGLLENTAPDFEATSAGEYQVVVSDLLSGCSFSQNTFVNEINPPVFNVDILSPAFSGESRIEINNIQGEGNFEFQLDNQPWVLLGTGETSLTLEDITDGIHVVRPRDPSGCGVFEVQFTILGFKPFFTPNADGINDYWNIRSLQNQPEAKIFIFDRYGKLIYEANPLLIGWDGTYQGRQMPAQDYWFRVEFTDLQTDSLAVFSGHFTLKR